MSARLKSETDKDNESTEEGKQTSYPALAIAYFVIQPLLTSRISMAAPPLPRIISPFPWVTITTNFRGKCTPTHSCVSAGSRRAGTGRKFVVGYEPALRMARQCEACRLVYLRCEKGCVPYLFLITRLAHQLAEKIILWIHRATNDPPSLSFTLFLVPSTYSTYDALFSSSSNTSNQIP